jgi:hypothetical protein
MGTVMALSPKYPSIETPKSRPTMSPSLSTRFFDGTPWMTSSLIEMQTLWLNVRPWTT